jgi:ABC-type transporter Mla subunit MlaD
VNIQKNSNSEIKITFGIDENLTQIILRICKALEKSRTVEEKLDKIIRNTSKIMATQQEFDLQITAANEKLDALGTAVADEAAQLKAFLDSLPAGVDTSALDGVIERLGGIAESVGGIFTPTENAPAPDGE